MREGKEDIHYWWMLVGTVRKGMPFLYPAAPHKVSTIENGCHFHEFHIANAYHGNICNSGKNMETI